MAINTNPRFAFGQNLTPAQLAQLRALVPKDYVPGLADAGRTLTADEMGGMPQFDVVGRSFSQDGKFEPSLSWNPGQEVIGNAGGTDEISRPTVNGGNWSIDQPRNVSTWGGNDVTGTWDGDGNWQGYSSGMTGLRAVGMIGLAALGGAYANGGFGAGATQATFTANDVAMMAANGMTDAQIAVAVGPEAASGLGLAGPGTGMTFAEATTLAAQQAGTTPPPGNGLQEPAVPPADPATPPPTTQPPGTTPPPGTGGPGLGDVVKVATALTPIIAATTVDPPATPETDDTRFAKMFDAMFADYTKLSARGDDMWNQYLTTFRPLENKFAQTALNYDTATRRETAANDATGQVASEYDQQRQQAQREMTAAGVDPSTMYALNHSSRIVQAKDQAQAANKARNDVEMQGLSLVKSAADFGRGISTTATQQQQVGQNGANAATANATGMANIQNQNTANANQATRDRNQLYGNLFNAIGTGVGMWASSEKKKHMGGKVDGLSAARAIEKSPAKHWRYRDGEGDGNTKARMGPTAEALHKVAPAVSDGKKVDGIAMMGLQHAAIGEISKRMAKIEKRLGLSDMKRRG